MSDWAVFRHPVFWGIAVWLGSMLLLGALLPIPSRWDKAVVIQICGGLPVLELQNGELWVRDRWRSYRVKGELKSLCRMTES